MQYMGGKAKIAKRIVAFLSRHRKEGQTFVEPFLGGCNILSLMDLPKVGSDVNGSIMMFYQALRDGWNPPNEVSEEEYKFWQAEIRPSPMKGFIGVACSFGGKWFGGYARQADGGRNYALNGYNTAMKTKPGLLGSLLVDKNYNELDIPPNSLIYCDPPYANTTKYASNGFDHDLFWQWVRAKTKEGHTVFVSEYSAPDDFECIWELERDCGLKQGKNGTKSVRTERIFKMKEPE